MSRKWRNLLIGVLVVAVLVVGIWLLSQGENDFSSKYSDTYDAYLKVHAADAGATENVKVDVASQIVFVEFDADKNSEANIIKGLSAIGVKAERAKAEKMELKGKPNGKPFCKMPPPGQQAKVKKCDAVESTKCDKKAVDCDKKQACGKAKADCGLKPTCDKKVADCDKKPACDKAKADCCDKAVAKVESKCCGKAGCCDSKCKQEGNKCCGKADCCPDMKCNK